MAKLIPFNENEQALIAGADAEMEKVLGHPVAIEMQIQTLIGLIGLIQLACRHPQVSEEMKRSAEHFVNGVGASLQEQGMHGLAALIKGGWVDGD